jgi:TBC1 domain family protein 5
MQDVQRTFPDNIIFESEHVQNLLLNVLFVWAKLNPNISYRQGMHELAAMIFMVVNEDSYPKDAPSMDVISELFDERHIEADTSILFFNLMKDVKPWYEVNHITSRPPTDTIPIIASCNRIYEYLKALDPELFNHIHDVNIN